MENCSCLATVWWMQNAIKYILLSLLQMAFYCCIQSGLTEPFGWVLWEGTGFSLCPQHTHTLLGKIKHRNSLPQHPNTAGGSRGIVVTIGGCLLCISMTDFGDSPASPLQGVGHMEMLGVYPGLVKCRAGGSAHFGTTWAWNPIWEAQSQRGSGGLEEGKKDIF